MKIVGYICIVILIATLLLVSKLITEAVIMTIAINDYSFWTILVVVLLGFIVSFAISSIILKLLYKVYKNIL